MKTYCLEVSGDFACFTRPEMKVERVSYDVITPSAARAIFEAVLWKPAIRWYIKKIEVLKPIKWINLRRNEVKCVISTQNIKKSMNSNKGQLGLYIEKERQQRAGLFLRDVQYRIHASFELLDVNKVKTEHQPHQEKKFMEMFERRAKKGQCVNQPYLGCREFAANFHLVKSDTSDSSPISETRNLGYMLYDLDYSDCTSPKPHFFHANLVKGVIEVPIWNSEEVRG